MKYLSLGFALMILTAHAAGAETLALRIKITATSGAEKRYEIVNQRGPKLREMNGQKVVRARSLKDPLASDLELAALRQIWMNNYRIKTKPKTPCKTVLEIEIPSKNERSSVCAGDLARLASSEGLIERLNRSF